MFYIKICSDLRGRLARAVERPCCFSALDFKGNFEVASALTIAPSSVIISGIIMMLKWMGERQS